MGSCMTGTMAVTPEALRRRTAPSPICELARSAPKRIAFHSKQGRRVAIMGGRTRNGSYEILPCYGDAAIMVSENQEYATSFCC
jgi:hypothetical protein